VIVEFDIFELVLYRYTQIFPGIVHITGFQQGNQFNRLGPDIFLGAVGDESVIQSRLLVEFFSKLQDHQGTVAAGIQIRVGMPPDNAFAVENFVPVLLGYFSGKAALIRIAQHQLVGGKTDIPGSEFRDQIFINHFEVRRSHDIGRFAQLGDHTGHLGAAPGFPLDIDIGVVGFKLFFNLCKRHCQAAGMKNRYFFFGRCNGYHRHCQQQGGQYSRHCN